MLCHPLSLPLCLCCGVLYESQSKKNSAQSLFSLVVNNIVVKEMLRLVYSDRSIMFFLTGTQIWMSVFTCMCLLPHGQPGQPAAGRLSLSTPSAPSCWTLSPLPFLSPPSPAGPSSARWFAPGHHEGGKEGGGGHEWRMEVRRIETERVQWLFTVTQYQVSILITVVLNFMYMAALTGSNSQQWL